MTGTEAIVQNHYGRGGLLQRLEAALRAAGKDPQHLAVEDLYPFDQLHGRGIVATTELAKRASLSPGLRVLDLGCGIGGASRYLTSACGCVVTGLDLTPEFVEVAKALFGALRPRRRGSSSTRAARSTCRSRTRASSACGATT